MAPRSPEKHSRLQRFGGGWRQRRCSGGGDWRSGGGRQAGRGDAGIRCCHIGMRARRGAGSDESASGPSGRCSPEI
ncbi:unnamed protein product [Pleuronectes platessa]|uniref:Uncharacterized protein n=1 Tax=Pleuronectes platessa TaxID=8262 RepID=A0A9N7YJC7_PLEPL|nr:unnamed protein product [Pleuronectes platessa]